MITPRAKVAELADAPDLGSGGATRGGSSPPFRTSRLGYPEEYDSRTTTAAQNFRHTVSRIP